MPRAGFGQGEDYSGLFASLYNQDEANRERLNREAEARNDERKAAKDAEMFSKFEHGELSGAEILDYIRSRVAQTAGDPSENAKWKDALRDYSQSISDQQAEDAFANGGSIHDLISYYRDRKANEAAGSPAYSEVNKRLNDLIDQSASEDLYLGAQRITEKISRGEASQDDLVAFYRRQLRGLRPGSPLRDDVLGRLTQAQVEQRNQQLDASIAQLDYKVSTGAMTADAANAEILRLAAPYQQNDPLRYYDLLQHGQQYMNSEGGALPNPGALSPYGAPPVVPGGGGSNPIGGPGPASFGQYGDRSTDFRFITQLDGSEFAKTNCVFASGAMLAQAMGIDDYNGGDLRWLSRDRQGGTTFNQLNLALGKLGLSGDIRRGMSYNEFIDQLGSGSPAVLAGISGNLPPSYHGNYMGRHAVYVDRYDPEKGFLVFDPAKKNNPNGMWWPPEVLRSFAWDGGANGGAVFAPPNLLTSQRRVTSGLPKPPRNVSVFDQPKRPETPRNYGVGSDRGVEGVAQNTLRQNGQTQQPRTNADGSPIPYGLGLPTTADEANEEIDILKAHTQRALAISDAFDRGDEFYREADGSMTPLSAALVQSELDAAYNSSDYHIALLYSMATPTNSMAAEAMAVATNRADLSGSLLRHGDQRQDLIFNQIQLNINKQFEYANENYGDPFASSAVVHAAITQLARFDSALDVSDPTGAGAVTPEFRDRVRAVTSALVAANTPGIDEATRNAAFDAANFAVGNDSWSSFFQRAANVTDTNQGIADGTLVRAIVTNEAGKPEWATLPAIQRPNADGSMSTVPDPNAGRTQAVIVDGQVVFAQVVPTASQFFVFRSNVDGASLAAALGVGGNTSAGGKGTPPKSASALALLESGNPIPSPLLSGIAPDVLARLVSQGFITSVPYQMDGITIPGTNETWLQDPQTLLWHKGTLPAIAQPNPNGMGTVMTDAMGVPDFHWAPNASNNGVLAPFSGSPTSAQDAFDSGKLNGLLPPPRYRNNNGDVVDDPGAFQPGAMYDRSRRVAPAGTPQVNFQTGFVTNRAQPSFPSAPSSAPPALPGGAGFDWTSMGGIQPGLESLAALGVSVGKQVGTIAKPFAPPPPAPVSARNVSTQTGFTLPDPSPRIQVAPYNPPAPTTFAAPAQSYDWGQAQASDERVRVPLPAKDKGKSFTPPPATSSIGSRAPI